MPSSILLFIVHNLLIFLHFVIRVAEHCHPDDKKALIAFNIGKNFPSRVPTTDYCKWYGVRCNPKTHSVNTLFLFNVGDFTGALPSAIDDLPYLTNPFIHKCPNLTGPIPRSITRLSRLTLLAVTYTTLSGAIPCFLDQPRELTQIQLYFNHLTGSILASLANLPKLFALSLDQNQLTGSIPESFGQFNTNQDFYLILTKNQLSGPIPNSLGRLNFTTLFPDWKNFTGDASMFFGKDKGVQNMYLSRNKLSFNMSNVIIPPQLSNLDISHNNDVSPWARS